jgi:putative component of membrane protein insertase Oxa1/YidC/SpoIIIJ protein YidD
MLAKIGKYIIEYYWRKVPDVERRVCIHKISCSNVVYNTFNEYGFIKGVIVYIKRRKSCNSYYKISIKNDNVIITTKYGEIIKEDLINPIIVKDYRSGIIHK